jgi:hypothetical protein
MSTLTDEAYALSDALVAIYAEMEPLLTIVTPARAELLCDLLDEAVAVGRRQDVNDVLRCNERMGWAA